MSYILTTCVLGLVYLCAKNDVRTQRHPQFHSTRSFILVAFKLHHVFTCGFTRLCHNFQTTYDEVKNTPLAGRICFSLPVFVSASHNGSQICVALCCITLTQVEFITSTLSKQVFFVIVLIERPLYLFVPFIYFPYFNCFWWVQQLSPVWGITWLYPCQSQRMFLVAVSYMSSSLFLKTHLFSNWNFRSDVNIPRVLCRTNPTWVYLDQILISCRQLLDWDHYKTVNIAIHIFFVGGGTSNEKQLFHKS